MAMVMGPTPPGTGVIHAARSAAARVFHVASEFPVGSRVDSHVDDDGAITNPLPGM